MVFWVTHFASAAKQPIKACLFNRNHLAQLQLRTGWPFLLRVGSSKCGLLWWQWFPVLHWQHAHGRVGHASGHVPSPLIISSSPCKDPIFLCSQLRCPAFSPLPSAGIRHGCAEGISLEWLKLLPKWRMHCLVLLWGSPGWTLVPVQDNHTVNTRVPCCTSPAWPLPSTASSQASSNCSSDTSPYCSPLSAKKSPSW